MKEEAIAIKNKMIRITISQFLGIYFCTLACSCMVVKMRSYGSDRIPNENHAAKSKDFTEQGYREVFKGRGLVMHYKIGDRFRLREKMFLAFSRSKIVYLIENSDSDVPRVENYLKNPDAYRYGSDNPYQVIKLVPAGTVIEIVKIAEIDSSPYPYFVIVGDNNWFRSSTFADDKFIKDLNGKSVSIKTFDGNLFDKL